MADSADVLKALSRNHLPGVNYSVLVPNMKGYETYSKFFDSSTL